MKKVNGSKKRAKNNPKKDIKVPRQPNPIVGIARAVCTSAFIMVAIIVLSAQSQAWILTPLIGILALFGIFMGFFASRK